MTAVPPPPPHEAALFRTIRGWGIVRGDNGVVGGVVEGLGARIGMARVPARIIVVVAALILNGLVLIAYAAAWGLLPDRRGNIIVQNFGRGVPNVGALIGIGLLTLFGLGSTDSGPGFFIDLPHWGNDGWGIGNILGVVFGILVPLAFLGGIITLVVVLVKRSSGGSPTPPPGAPYAAAPVAQASAAPGDAGTSADASAGDSSEVPPAAVADAPAPAPVYAAMPEGRTYVAPPAYYPPYTHPAAASYPAPPAPFMPPQGPRIPGPGRVAYLTALAWMILAAAGVTWFDRLDRLDVHPAIAWFVAFVTGLGVLAILVSLAGRKLGFLGFCAIALTLPLLIIAGNSDQLRDSYADGRGIDFDGDNSVTISFEPTVIEAPFDPTLEFGTTYREVLFNGACYTVDTEVVYGGTSIARFNEQGLTAATTRDITSEITYVTVTAGTSIVLSGETNAQATLVFADRGFQCDFWDVNDSYARLTNPDAPVLNLEVKDDQFANTIVIKEVRS